MRRIEHAGVIVEATVTVGYSNQEMDTKIQLSLYYPTSNATTANPTSIAKISRRKEWLQQLISSQMIIMEMLRNQALAINVHVQIMQIPLVHADLAIDVACVKVIQLALLESGLPQKLLSGPLETVADDGLRCGNDFYLRSLPRLDEIATVDPTDVIKEEVRKCLRYCDKAKALLNSLGAKFLALELDLMPNGAETQNGLAELTGQRTVPNIFINAKSVGGCDALHALHAQKKLVPLLEEAK